EALKRLDAPQPPQPDVELRMNVLIASNVEGVVNQFPNDLSDVVKQIQATLNYKSYWNVATVIQRVRTGSQHTGINGVAEIPAKILEIERPVTATYNFNVRFLSLSTEPSSGYLMQLTGATFELQGPPSQIGRANIGTDLNLRNGEKVVVGTTTLGNKGLILVLSARVIK